MATSRIQININGGVALKRGDKTNGRFSSFRVDVEGSITIMGQPVTLLEEASVPGLPTSVES